MSHLCHALRCTRPVPPRMLMCGKHWKMVPRTAQVQVYATYVPGQERRKDPTAAYLMAAERAIVSVATAEGILTTEQGIQRIQEADARSERVSQLFNEYGRLL